MYCLVGNDKITLSTRSKELSSGLGGFVLSIATFQAVDSCSIPGLRSFQFFISIFSSAHQLWVAESPDEGVCSLAMINAEFALEKGEIPLKSGLLFAGHYNGQISLVDGKGKN